MSKVRPASFSLGRLAKAGGDEMLNAMTAYSRNRPPEQGRDIYSRSAHRTGPLAMKTECEQCGRPLPSDSPNARICSFEDTYCAWCAIDFQNHCPGCNGVLERRPARPVRAQDYFPRAETAARVERDNEGRGRRRRGGIL